MFKRIALPPQVAAVLLALSLGGNPAPGAVIHFPTDSWSVGHTSEPGAPDTGWAGCLDVSITSEFLDRGMTVRDADTAHSTGVLTRYEIYVTLTSSGTVRVTLYDWEGADIPGPVLPPGDHTGARTVSETVYAVPPGIADGSLCGDLGRDYFTRNVSPEPGTVALLVPALLWLGFRRLRRSGSTT